MDDKNGMTLEVMEYMVWVVETASEAFFDGDKGKAYETLK